MELILCLAKGVEIANAKPRDSQNTGELLRRPTTKGFSSMAQAQGTSRSTTALLLLRPPPNQPPRHHFAAAGVEAADAATSLRAATLFEVHTNTLAAQRSPTHMPKVLTNPPPPTHSAHPSAPVPSNASRSASPLHNG